MGQVYKWYFILDLLFRNVVINYLQVHCFCRPRTRMQLECYPPGNYNLVSEILGYPRTSPVTSYAVPAWCRKDWLPSARQSL
ncbi:hypothetical protein LIER_00340 [Lithospermum erythrorhizon]|uniref:Uncharacterized protein n=1 Tax=Lithospermum erythrorhizon TaxID=34254 RepID=A0AAV3NLH9_LITER